MKKTYIYGAMAAGLLLTGCKSDDFNPNDGRSEIDKVLYVNMNIRGDIMDGTRAAIDNGTPVDNATNSDFDSGTGESEVSNAYFVFYDEDGNTVGEVINVALKNPVTVTGNGSTVERYYQSTVPVSVNKGEKDPVQVVCYINPISPASLQNPLSTIETVTREELYTTNAGQKYFAMSNSVFYPTGDDDTKRKPQVAVPVASNQLFATESAAQAALEEVGQPNVINIYVERYASKLNFKAVEAEDYVTATSLINDNSEIPVVLSFVPEFWAVNACCTESYVVKSFRTEPEAGAVIADDYTFSVMDSRINASSVTAPDLENGGVKGIPVYGTPLTIENSWQWNSPAYNRSYWSCSPAYFNLNYPRVSSDVVEGGINQHYFSYDELGVKKGTYSADDTSDHYFHETTVGGRALISENPAAAVPSVIYVGTYKLSLNGTPLADETTFYTYMNGSNGHPLVYFDAQATSDLGISKIDGGESMLRRFIEQASGLYKYDEETEEYVRFDITDEDDMKTLVSVLDVKFPDDEVKGDMVLSERCRTLQFKNGANTTGIYVAAGNGYRAIGSGEKDITLVEANKALMSQVGYCYKYMEGAGYFNIPVKHYGWYRKGNTQKDATKIDWNLVRVGDFGMVRNHAYSVEATKITGLATGIGGKSNPIVPPSDTKDYYVAYRVNILKWAMLPKQSVEL
ncbi:MAG: fimbria major subunit [Muribaculaceae bacterium]|nr:fimbria major subunit [Muribaculaceae bacterium]